MRRRCLASMMTLAAALATGRAGALPPASPGASAQAEPAQRADVLFQKGIRLYAAKKWKDAEEAFLAAFALNPTFDVAYNLGSVEHQLGKHAKAAEHLSYALRRWPLIEAATALRATAEKRLAASRAEVGAIAVRVSSAQAEVRVDGTLVGKAPLEGEVFVDPGEHTIEASLARYKAARETVKVQRGASATVTLLLQADDPALWYDPTGGVPARTPSVPTQAAPAQPEPARPAPEVKGAPVQPAPEVKAEERSAWPAVALGAASVVGLGLGVGMTVASVNARADARSRSAAILKDGRGCAHAPASYGEQCAELQRATNRAGTFGDVALGSYIASGMIAAAALTYVLWPRRATTAPASALVVPLVEGDGGGMAVVGAW